MTNQRLQASVAAQLETINAASSVAMSTMLSTSTAQMSTMAAQNTEQMRVANSTMVSNMALQQAMISTVVGTMNASVNAAVSVAGESEFGNSCLWRWRWWAVGGGDRWEIGGRCERSTLQHACHSCS